ncbi:hypothetical protein B0H66DRAFT_638090 [Apodospora peruviana]|uniref:Rhodopsin domain-containing protein n=1 Tax=Apodospora peruviana TaxID=516989 RepID=A0AAE0MCP1_9PEZI|nr:hypothetical protein B0H66DRAFT_638090 [Apodospora peruviana]
MLPRSQATGFNPNLIPSTDELAQYDFTDKSSLAPAVWHVNLTFIVLVGVAVSLRIFTRAYMTRHFFIDDVLAVFAALFTMISASTALTATRYGLGLHVWNVQQPMLENLTNCVQLMYVAHVFYAAATAVTKLSIITSYLRIFPDAVLRKLLYATAALVIGIGISAIFATVFQCWPVQAAWDFSIESRQCFPFLHFLYANAAISIFTDLLLVVAPLPYFWSLKLPIRQKLVICILFGAGFIAFAASIVRIVILKEIKGIDVTYYLASPLNWTVIECSLGIICVSIPPMRPLLAKISPRFLSDYLTRYSNSRTGGSRYQDNNSRVWSSPRSKVFENIEHDMDRQLREFEFSNHHRRIDSGSNKTMEMQMVSVGNSTAQLTEPVKEEGGNSDRDTRSLV